MRLGIISHKTLTTVVDLVIKAGRCNDAPFTFTPEGLLLQVIDPAHVAMIELKIDADDFSEYGVGSDDISLFLEVDLIKKRLAALPSGDIQLDFDKELNLFRMTSGKTKFEIPLIGLPPEWSDMKDIRPHLTKTEVDPDEFFGGLRNGGLVDDLTEIRLNGDELTLASGESRTTAETTIDLEENTETTCASSFEIPYLIEAVKVMKTAAIALTLYIGDDKPLIIEFDMGKKSSGSYKIAPRVEGDD
jgi:proliferating cell nuclear antigen